MVGDSLVVSASLGKSYSRALRAFALAMRFSKRFRSSRSLGVLDRSKASFSASRLRIPHLQRPHFAELGHVLSIGPDAGEHRIFGAALVAKPLLRQAITKLAARRLTSHSQGAGSVSSRSWMSKMIRRSGVAKPRKFAEVGVAARLHANAGGRRHRQIHGHVERRSAIEREGRRQHAPVAKGNQLGDASLVAFFDQLHRIGSFFRRFPISV